MFIRVKYGLPDTAAAAHAGAHTGRRIPGRHRLTWTGSRQRGMEELSGAFLGERASDDDDVYAPGAL